MTSPRFAPFSAIVAVATLALASLFGSCNDDAKKLADKEKELAELRQLAELDKREMENQYAEFALQYGELRKSVKDDSLAARLDAERDRAERLLTELKNVKSSSSAEILRLKKELATVRAVLRDYVRQVDSLQRINSELLNERDAAREEAARTRQENAAVNERNAGLSEQVAIAAQLNATAVQLTPLKKNGKAAKRSKDVKRFSVAFTIARNVTAAPGNRIVYVRLLKPNGQLLGGAGQFKYENRTLDCSAQRSVEYNGQDTRVQLYVQSDDYIGPGRYQVHIFADGQMIGQEAMTMER